MGLFSTHWVHLSIGSKGDAGEMWTQQKNEHMNKGPSSSGQSVPGPSLFPLRGLTFSVTICQFLPEKRLDHSIKGPLEPSLPETPTATHLSIYLLHRLQARPLTGGDFPVTLTRLICWARKKILIRSSSWSPYPMPCPKWPRNQLGNQNGKRSMHQHSVKKKTIIIQ